MCIKHAKPRFWQFYLFFVSVRETFAYFMHIFCRGENFHAAKIPQTSDVCKDEKIYFFFTNRYVHKYFLKLKLLHIDFSLSHFTWINFSKRKTYTNFPPISLAVWQILLTRKHSKHFSLWIIHSISKQLYGLFVELYSLQNV